MKFQTVAYVRVSSVDQHTDRQVHAVGDVDRTFTDHLSGGSRQERVALAELLDYVREGDTVRVASMDRLARSVIDLAQLVKQCTDKGVAVEFVGEGLTFAKDTENPYAMFQLHMLGAVAQLERSLIRERQRQGIAIARAKRTYKGRKPVLSVEQIAQARASVVLKVPKAQIARDMGVARSVLYDALASRGAYVTITPPPLSPPPRSLLVPGAGQDCLIPVRPGGDSVGVETAGKRFVPASGEAARARPSAQPVPVIDQVDAVPVKAPRQESGAQETPAPPVTRVVAKVGPSRPGRSRKRWYVVEVDTAHAQDLDAVVAIMSTYASKQAAERGRGRLGAKTRGRETGDAVTVVRTADQIHAYYAYDTEAGSYVIKKGPPA